MERQENCIFPTEDALEMILMFDRYGIISYANDTAKKKLEYESELCGRNISDIFPNTFYRSLSWLTTTGHGCHGTIPKYRL